MNTLNPQSPFVWPEHRAIEEMSTYEHCPPFGDLALRSQWQILNGEPTGAIDAALESTEAE